MFGFKKKEVKIYSPVNGKVVKLEEVPDEMFAKKLLGDGVAIQIEGDTICSPQDGVIKALFPTKHAFALETKDGVEILVHIGIDTVDLDGEGFEAIAKVEDVVKIGQPIIKVNRELINEKGFNLITPIIITNIESIRDINILEKGSIDRGEEVIKCKL